MGSFFYHLNAINISYFLTFNYFAIRKENKHEGMKQSGKGLYVRAWCVSVSVCVKCWYVLMLICLSWWFPSPHNRCSCSSWKHRITVSSEWRGKGVRTSTRIAPPLPLSLYATAADLPLCLHGKTKAAMPALAQLLLKYEWAFRQISEPRNGAETSRFLVWKWHLSEEWFG